MHSETIKYPQFLKMIDEQTSRMSPENLAAFVHEIARKWPEEERYNFWELLQDFSSGTMQKNDENCGGNSNPSLLNEVDAVLQKLQAIDEQEILLDSEYNEEYDDWYNDDNPFILIDTEGLLDDIHEALNLVHRCLDMEQYQKGYELADFLSCISVGITGVALDYEDACLQIRELDNYDLLNWNYKNFCLDCLVLTYMGNPIEERASELHRMFYNLACYNASLEAILQHSGKELPDLDIFLPEWISTLGAHRDESSLGLLKEALSMIHDETAQLKIVMDYVETYPELIQQYLIRHQNSGEDEKMLEIGMKALERLPEKLKICSELALLIADFACKTEKNDIAENCWMTAFRSDTVPVHYFRLRFLSQKWEDIHKSVTDYYKELYRMVQIKHNRPFMGYCNRLSMNDFCVLSFFEGEFDLMRSAGMKTKNALGWSSTFNKNGIALMLLLINKNPILSDALQNMVSRSCTACGFSREIFEAGTGSVSNLKDKELFLQLFNKWKYSVALSEETIADWMSWIERMLKFRTQGIMAANRRNYYDECAVFIAAFGDVKESLGFKNAKQNIMAEYKTLYGRRRNFMAAMGLYGMKK